MKISLLVSLLAGLSLPAFAAPLTQSTFTEIIKDVNVVAADTKATAPAQVSAVVKAPDLVRTGPDSRAELTAADQTITRVGANSVFSFEPQGRSLDLQQGSVLFYSPKGNGGGTVTSGGASAAVLGSTMICSVGPDGSFKTILLEGKHGCTITLKNGQTVTLHSGQMIVILPDGTFKVLNIDLAKLVKTSFLVNGFNSQLGSMPLIQVVINDQQHGGGAPGQGHAVGTLNNNTYSTFTIPGSVGVINPKISASGPISNPESPVFPGNVPLPPQ